ncbi:hypothetical protein PZN54_11025 [Staphylococcus capitis]|uniref:hypothetical protein n=1 Tax=Staphylococcus TaxID=1279 RepID=UPI0022F06159|nr:MULTISPECIES: hypothetical protein [Staphylococcus]MCG1060621.1 hypothetical protein [Staphylococcus epidermidis]MDH9600753.1 hypothetical protein [Staphylococcus capitis]MDH9624333.1 hypothetical protein [Staphylococcus capitis]
MVEQENTEVYSKEKYDSFIEAAHEHIKDIERAATIIYELETKDLSLTEKDTLKAELNDKVHTIKSDSMDMLDSLSTEYQLYDATAPRISMNLNGFKMLKDKVVLKNDDYRLNHNEAQDDNAFYHYGD